MKYSRIISTVLWRASMEQMQATHTSAASPHAADGCPHPSHIAAEQQERLATARAGLQSQRDNC